MGKEFEELTIRKWGTRMSGGLIQKLEQAEIQRDKYKAKWRLSVESEKKALKSLKVNKCNEVFTQECGLVCSKTLEIAQLKKELKQNSSYRNAELEKVILELKNEIETLSLEFDEYRDNAI